MYDVAIIGGGIVGLATGLALIETFPRLRLVVVEKESRVGTHQTGHNSGVIHSGIYYRPGSYKARLTVEGAGLMIDFCERNGVRYERIGKVIVATTEAELPRLQTLYERGTANGVPGLRLLEPGELRAIEPHAAAIRAIHSPTTAIVDFTEVATAMDLRLRAAGAEVLTGRHITRIVRDGAGVCLCSSQGEIFVGATASLSDFGWQCT